MTDEIAGVEEEAVSYIEWVYANPGQPAEDYASALAKTMCRIHREAEASAYERAAKVIEGDPHKERYRKWSFWPSANYSWESPIAKFALDAAAAIRALKELP